MRVVRNIRNAAWWSKGFAVVAVSSAPTGVVIPYAAVTHVCAPLAHGQYDRCSCLASNSTFSSSPTTITLRSCWHNSQQILSFAFFFQPNKAKHLAFLKKKKKQQGFKKKTVKKKIFFEPVFLKYQYIYNYHTMVSIWNKISKYNQEKFLLLLISSSDLYQNKQTNVSIKLEEQIGILSNSKIDFKLFP